MNSESVRRHFDEIAADYDRWKEKAEFYYQAVKRMVAEVVPPGARVLEVGCGTGDILASLRPSEGLGTDISPKMVERARRKHPHLRFEVHDLVGPPLDERFDHIVAVDVMEHVPEIEPPFRTMAAMLDEHGTLVIVTANPSWAPILHLAEKLRLKMPEGDHVWRTHEHLVRAARASGLEEVSFERSLLFPKNVPGFRRLNDAHWAEGLRRRRGLVQRLLFSRPSRGERVEDEPGTVSHP